MTSGVIEVGIAIDPEDQVVQYESQNPNNKKAQQPQESISERRFVTLNQRLPLPNAQDSFLSDASG